MSWLYLGLGLVVSISQFWIVYHTVRNKDFVALARVRVSSLYFAVWIVYRIVRKKDLLALAMVRVSSQYFQFGIVYHTVSQEWCPGSR